METDSGFEALPENANVIIRQNFGLDGFSAFKSALQSVRQQHHNTIRITLDGVFSEQVSTDVIGMLAWAVEFNQSQGCETIVEARHGSRDRKVLDITGFCKLCEYRCDGCVDNCVNTERATVV